MIGVVDAKVLGPISQCYELSSSTMGPNSNCLIVFKELYAE